ncbi:hypothetical protein EPN42_13105 [bacterium]|nr:MAG: hypothetical protein EPN42_13105 [bacterium]
MLPNDLVSRWAVRLLLFVVALVVLPVSASAQAGPPGGTVLCGGLSAPCAPPAPLPTATPVVGGGGVGVFTPTNNGGLSSWVATGLFNTQGWALRAGSLASALGFALFGLALGILAIKTLLEGGSIYDFTARLSHEVIALLVVLGLILNFQWLMGLVVHSACDAAMQITATANPGASGSATNVINAASYCQGTITPASVLSAGKLVAQGVLGVQLPLPAPTGGGGVGGVVTGVLGSIAMSGLGAILAGTTFLIVWGCFLFVALELLGVTVESVIVGSIGVIFLPFALLPATRRLSEGMKGYLAELGMRVFFIYVSVGVGLAACQSVANAAYNDDSLLQFLMHLAAAGMYVWFVFHSDKIAKSITTGQSTLHGWHDFVRPAIETALTAVAATIALGAGAAALSGAGAAASGSAAAGKSVAPLNMIGRGGRRPWRPIEGGGAMGHLPSPPPPELPGAATAALPPAPGPGAPTSPPAALPPVDYPPGVAAPLPELSFYPRAPGPGPLPAPLDPPVQPPRVARPVAPHTTAAQRNEAASSAQGESDDRVAEERGEDGSVSWRLREDPQADAPHRSRSGSQEQQVYEPPPFVRPSPSRKAQSPPPEPPISRARPVNAPPPEPTPAERPSFGQRMARHADAAARAVAHVAGVDGGADDIADFHPRTRLLLGLARQVHRARTHVRKIDVPRAR